MSNPFSFSRTLAVIKYFDDSTLDFVNELIEQNNLSSELLIDSFEPFELRIIKDVINYEKNIQSFLLTQSISKEKLVELRAQKIAKISTLLQKNMIHLLDNYFQINRTVQILESDYNWSNFSPSSMQLENFNEDHTFITLIKKSIVGGVAINEIPLVGFDLLLHDLENHGCKILGWDILEAITSSNENFDRKKMKTLTEKICDKLLEHLIVYDALNISYK